MYLFVPVILEQAIIASTVEFFRTLLQERPWLHVIFVTTARESKDGDRATTHDLLEALLGEPGSRHPRLGLVRDPRPFGVMAHQLNYAIDLIASKVGVSFFIGIYNADSVTPALAIDYARARLISAPSLILQQYAVFRVPASRTFEARIRSHVAAWQSRWSLQFELGRLLIDHLIFPEPKMSARAINIARPFHYVIGHGLFLSITMWQWASGFAEDEINEDAFFGLVLHVGGQRIAPIPYLETADPPPTILAYLKQQSVWFNGPLYAFRYAWKLHFGSHGRHSARPRFYGLVASVHLAIAAAKLSLHAIYWLLGPPLVLLISVLMSTNAQWYVGILWYLLVLYFVYGLNVIAHIAAVDLGATEGSIGGPIAAISAYLLHGVGPLLCMARVMSGRNMQESKYKTEREP